MLKLAAMSKGTSESMNIYKFLCQKIGSEEVVKIRRLTFAINDIGKRCQFITSGSKGEGLDFKGSDLDIMHVDTSFKVYQSENDVDYEGTNCFATADTFHDYQIQSYEINESLLCRHIRCLHHILPTFSTICMHHYSCKVDRFSKLLFNFLHHSNTGLSRRLFALQLSAAFMLAIESTQYVHSAGNKYRYVMYKHDLSNLMIGLHSDAVSGLLKLASFFYVHRNYTDALTVLTHTLQKCTNEKFYTAFFDYTDTFTHFQNHAVDMLKNEKICTIIKLLTIHAFRFGKSSSIVPQELQLEVPQELQLHLSHSFHPLPFAHFLCFLCYYHLHDITSCIQCIQQLEHVRLTLYDYSIYHPNSQETHILCGIAYQMMGETHLAFNAFQNALEIYVNNLTSAASRLSSLF
ncbi:TTC30 [Mytilus coruscus]|uniref:TTC30 n=1 Tax=Mytilus coruscus TaxID=42192 RepID=A0A6J8AQE4_MYTCO|nr:TTC30 [Mytilus coruscus]